MVIFYVLVIQSSSYILLYKCSFVNLIEYDIIKPSIFTDQLLEITFYMWKTFFLSLDKQIELVILMDISLNYMVLIRNYTIHCHLRIIGSTDRYSSRWIQPAKKHATDDGRI